MYDSVIRPEGRMDIIAFKISFISEPLLVLAQCATSRPCFIYRQNFNISVPESDEALLLRALSSVFMQFRNQLLALGNKLECDLVRSCGKSSHPLSQCVITVANHEPATLHETQCLGLAVDPPLPAYRFDFIGRS